MATEHRRGVAAEGSASTLGGGAVAYGDPRTGWSGVSPWDAVRGKGPGVLIGALSSLLAASAATMVLLGRIWGVDGLASLSFTRLDAWCDIQTEATGGRCWRDYAAVRFDSPGDRPGDA